MNDESEKDLVPLTECGTNEEAEVLKSVLDSEGIFALIQGGGHRGMLGNVYGSYIEVRILVRSEDVNRARELITRNAEDLEKAAEEAALAEGAEGTDAQVQPLPEGVAVAGEDYAARRRRLAWTLVGLFWVLPLVIILWSTVMKSCGR